MGTNRRYAEQLDRRRDDKILERISRDGPLHSLTAAEIRLDRVPMTLDPSPKPVLAWVRFGDTPVRVRAVAERWTADAVGISFSVGEQRMRCWIWASACEPDQSRPPAITP